MKLYSGLRLTIEKVLRPKVGDRKSIHAGLDWRQIKDSDLRMAIERVFRA